MTTDAVPKDIETEPALTHADRVERDRPAYPSLYSAVWPDLVPIARSLGYALLIHGSLSRDLDLVAVPWTEDAQDVEVLIEALRAKLGAWVGDAVSHPRDGRKPHGRMGAIIVLGGHAVIDLSIMPRLQPFEPAAARVLEARRKFTEASRQWAASSRTHRDLVGTWNSPERVAARGRILDRQADALAAYDALLQAEEERDREAAR